MPLDNDGLKWGSTECAEARGFEGSEGTGLGGGGSVLGKLERLGQVCVLYLAVVSMLRSPRGFLGCEDEWECKPALATHCCSLFHRTALAPVEHLELVPGHRDCVR